MTYKEVKEKIRYNGLFIKEVHYIKSISFELLNEKEVRLCNLTQKQFDKVSKEYGLVVHKTTFSGITIRIYKINKFPCLDFQSGIERCKTQCENCK